MRKIGETLDWLSCFALGTMTFFLSATGDLHWLWTFPGWGALGVGWINLRRMWREHRTPIDPRTGRPVADHGEGHHAVQFAIEEIEDHWERSEFLIEWMHGGAWEGWPEFYPWLKEREIG